MKLRLLHVCAIVATLVLVASALPWPEALEHWNVCSFRSLTGLPCPGCGLTRGFRALAHGDFAAAWQHNPFTYPFFLVALALALAPLWTRIWPRAEERLLRGRFLGAGVSVLLVGLLAFGAWRLIEAATQHA